MQAERQRAAEHRAAQAEISCATRQRCAVKGPSARSHSPRRWPEALAPPSFPTVCSLPVRAANHGAPARAAQSRGARRPGAAPQPVQQRPLRRGARRRAAREVVQGEPAAARADEAGGRAAAAGGAAHQGGRARRGAHAAAHTVRGLGGGGSGHLQQRAGGGTSLARRLRLYLPPFHRLSARPPRLPPDPHAAARTVRRATG